MSDIFVGLGLGLLQLGTNIFTDVDVGDIDREYLEGGADIEAALEDDFRNAVWRLKDGLVGIGGADGGHDPLPDAGDDGLFKGGANIVVEIRAHGDTSAGFDLNAIFGNPIDRSATTISCRALDDFGVDRSTNRFEHRLAGAFSCEIDGTGALPVEGDVSLVSGDEGLNGLDDVTLSKVVGFEVVGTDLDASLDRSDAGIDDERGRNATEAHGDECRKADGGTR